MMNAKLVKIILTLILSIHFFACYATMDEVADSLTNGHSTEDVQPEEGVSPPEPPPDPAATPTPLPPQALPTPSPTPLPSATPSPSPTPSSTPIPTPSPTPSPLPSPQSNALIQPSMVVSRLSGVSPLAVFFDATATTHSDPLIRPFHDLDFSWDFGDANARFTNTTSLPANAATGALAAHVFELPSGVSSRTYTVTLTVMDASGATAQVRQDIQVSDFVGTTYYVSDRNGTDSHDGLSPSTPFQTWDKGIRTLFQAAGPKRVLFERGNTFPNTTSFGGSNSISNKTGPYIIGAYGSGAKPVIQTSTHLATTLGLNTNVTDVRLIDIVLAGPGTGTGLYPGQNTLLLRSELRKFDTGVSVSGVTKTRNFFIDSVFSDNDAYAIYYAGAKDPALGASIFVLWYDAFGAVLRTDVLGKLNGTQPWTNLQGTLQAPPRSVRARIQLFGGEKPNSDQTTRTIWFDDLAFMDPSSGVNLLADPSFEHGGGSWQESSRAGRSLVASPVHSGLQAQEVIVQSQWPRFVFQEVPVIAGRTYGASGWVQTQALNSSGPAKPNEYVAVLASHFEAHGFQPDGVTPLSPHLIRTFLSKSVFSGNHFSGDTEHDHLKFCGITAPFAADFNIISNNLFTSPTTANWWLSFGPQNTSNPEYVQNLIIERNTFGPPSISGKTALQSRGANAVTIRQNTITSGFQNRISAGSPVWGFSTWEGWQVYQNSSNLPDLSGTICTEATASCNF